MQPSYEKKPRVAGAGALAWGGMLRIGEVLDALRSDLLLLQDVQRTADVAMMSIRTPKTRFRAARHQAVRIDQPDVLAIVELAFERIPNEKLWAASGQTLRTRFRQVCSALGLPTSGKGEDLFLELASLRPGGATWLMMTCEDAELVRRRGRWWSQRIVEIYIQEVASLQFLPVLGEPGRNKVFAAVGCFHEVLRTPLSSVTPA